MTTYLTTEQTLELARDADLDWHAGYLLDDERDNRYHTLCNLAIQSYIDSLAEGLPEPVHHIMSDGKSIGYYSRDQLLACIAAEQDKWHAEHKCECSTEDACRFARERDLALKELAKAKGER